ncbi:MAG: DUF5671 domain-containing protein [Pseudomonadota bacterium]
MADRDPLRRFVEAALATGRDRAEIRTALAAAGWSAREIDDALGAFAEGDFTPPVPRPRPVVSARDFFVYALMSVALGVAAFALIRFGHIAVDRVFDLDLTTWQRNGLSRFGAMVLVFAPIYLWVSRSEARRLARDPARQRSAIRKWTYALIQLVTLLTLLGALSYGVYLVLQGDSPLADFLKVAITMGVMGGLFLLHRREAQRGGVE